MDKDVRPYKQRGDTCAIACMMMVLEYFKIIPKANWHDERRLYKIYGSKYLAGTPFSALAFHMAKNGLDVSIYHKNDNYFENKGSIEKYTFDLAISEYNKYLEYAKNKGANILKGVNITSDTLKIELQEGNLVILAGEIYGGYHAILLTGYDEKGFIVCDPLYKTKQSRTFQAIENFMNTSIGKWYISISDKTKEKKKES